MGAFEYRQAEEIRDAFTLLTPVRASPALTEIMARYRDEFFKDQKRSPLARRV